MKQVHFHGKIRVICKRAEYIDGGMHDDAGQKAFAAIKNRDKKEAYRDRKDDLTQVIDKIHAAAVEQVDNMSDAESHAGDDNGGSYVILCDGDKQEASRHALIPFSILSSMFTPGTNCKNAIFNFIYLLQFQQVFFKRFSCSTIKTVFRTRFSGAFLSEPEYRQLLQQSELRYEAGAFPR